MAKTASSAPAMATRSMPPIGFSSWRGFTPLPAVIRLRMAKIAPADNEQRRGKARRVAERQEGREQQRRTTSASVDRTGADLAQHLAAVELPHRHEIGDVEERGDAGKRAEHARRGAPALAGGIDAGGDRDRHEEGREAGAHQRHEGHLEAAVIGTAADGDAAEQRHEDHAHLAVAHHPERRHVAELVQRHDRGQHRRDREAAQASARTTARG